MVTTKLAPFHITDDRECSVLHPRSDAEMSFKCLHPFSNYSFKHNVMLSLCDPEKVVLLKFYSIILYFFMLRAINQFENIAARWDHFCCTVKNGL